LGIPDNGHFPGPRQVTKLVGDNIFGKRLGGTVKGHQSQAQHPASEQKTFPPAKERDTGNKHIIHHLFNSKAI
jgi:hypothetical protein